MKTRIEEAAREYIKESFDFGFMNEALKRITLSDYSQLFIAGAEFMQKEIKELEEQLKNSEDEVVLRGEYYNRVKAQNKIMREFMEIRLDNLNNSKEYNRSNYKTTEHQRLEEALEKVGEV